MLSLDGPEYNLACATIPVTVVPCQEARLFMSNEPDPLGINCQEAKLFMSSEPALLGTNSRPSFCSSVQA